MRAIRYHTSFGPGTLIWRESLLVAHSLPGVSDAPGTGVPPEDSVSPGTPAEQDMVELLESYFSGDRPDIRPEDLPLDRSGWTGFQSRVAAALAAVPRGEAVTYAALAEAAGHPGAQRAVGNFMAANPFPVIIPCHRVIRSDGSLGGFSGGEGWKARLLELEGYRRLFPGRG